MLANILWGLGASVCVCEEHVGLGITYVLVYVSASQQVGGGT